MNTIAVDFDGVIHKYSKGWQKGEIYDPPIKGAFIGIIRLHQLGYEIVVFTARDDLDPVREWFWSEYDKAFPNSPHIPIRITNIKPPALWYIDDRAIMFKNWEDTVTKIVMSAVGFHPSGNLILSRCSDCLDYVDGECESKMKPFNIEKCYRGKEE